MERRLHQGRHDAPHGSLVAAPVALSIMLHSQPGTQKGHRAGEAQGPGLLPNFCFKNKHSRSSTDVILVDVVSL